MSMFSALEISGSAMEAQRQRAEVTAANMANAETTRTPSGGPYHRKQVVVQSSGNTPFQMMLTGFRRIMGREKPAVRVARVVDDPTPNVMRYEPGHPDADAKGYVAYPGDQSNRGNGRPDGRCAFVSVECSSSQRHQTNDSRLHGHP